MFVVFVAFSSVNGQRSISHSIVIIAKNYLVKDEIDKLNRLVMLFLESAELRVKERKDLTLDYWRSNVDALLTFQGQAVLKGNGQVSNGEMEAYAKEVYCRFDERRKKMDAQNADEEDLRFLENLENEIKNRSQWIYLAISFF